MRRYTLKYEFSTDGITWIDFTDAVDSMQTKLNYSLCTQGFLSAKDTVNFVLPATTLSVKTQLINALLGQGDVYFRMYIPTPVPVMWDGENVLWNSDQVYWKGVDIGFMGIIDRSSLDLRSYPLPTSLSLTAQDLSVLHLDDKVDHEIVLENKKVSQIVEALLLDAGYTSYDVTGMDVADDRVLDAFVVDKDRAKTYRQYIDTLLFEAPGYVLDFTANGSARIVRLPWDDANGAARTIDNPMNANGIQIKSAFLKEDGVKVKWSSLKWGEHMPLWRDGIEADWDSDYGDFVGDIIKMGRYWPENGELVPSFMEFSTEWLDTPYLRKDSRLQNEDLSVIMAKQGTVSASIRAFRGMYGGEPRIYEFPVPEGYPVPLDFQGDPYNLSANPSAWAKKAWYLLYNPQWSPVVADPDANPSAEDYWYFDGSAYVQATETQIVPGRQYYLGATYTAVTPQIGDNPAYEGWFVFDGTNYVQTTDTTVQPGTTYYEGKDGEVNLVGFVIYGDVLYRDKINTLEIEDAKNPKEYTSEYIYDETHAKAFMNFYWNFLNTSRFSMSWAEPYIDDPLGSVVEITQKGMVYNQDAVIVAKSIQFINDNTPIVSYSAVGVAVPTLENGVAYSITRNGNTSIEQIEAKEEIEKVKEDVEEIVVDLWNFNLSVNSFKRNLRYVAETPQSITATATVTGYEVTPSWTVIDMNTGNTVASGTGMTYTFTVAWDNAYTKGLKVQMSGTGMATVEKYLTVVDETEYDHDWGTFFPEFGENEYTLLPDHFTKDGVDCDVIEGDFFVATGTWAVDGTAVVSPSGDPSAQGWYQRTGDGSASRPYGYYPTSHTSVQPGVTYYVPGQTFNSGWAYIYQGFGWTSMDITNEARAWKASRLLDDLVSANKQIPSDNSNYSIWKWAKNFVAQNALIQNLFSQAITILTGGYIKGGERYNDSGTIVDWSKKGFWFGADGTLKASLQSDGNNNTYVGTGVGANNNEPGSYNTALGYEAMYKTKTGGNYNVAIGYQALHENLTADNQIAIGYKALFSLSGSAADNNVAIGTEAMTATTSGYRNISIGYQSMHENTTGHENVAIGVYAMGRNTTGNDNIGIGPSALSYNTTGSWNIVIGKDSVTTGNDNLAIGNNNGSYSLYSGSGSFQMSLMGRLVHLEFASTRQNKQIHDALWSFFDPNSSTRASVTVSAIGVFDNRSVGAITFNKAGSITIYDNANQSIATLTSVATSTYTGRTILFFVPPIIVDPLFENYDDCLTT